jgi:hypothetical protein
MTGLPPPGHAIAYDAPSGTGGDLVRALQADGYLRVAKLRQSDGSRLVSAAAMKERRSRR